MSIRGETRDIMLRIGCLIRRKRSLVLYGCLAAVLLFSLVLLTGTFRGNYPLDLPTDYDLNYDTSRQKSGDRGAINEGNYIDEPSIVLNAMAIHQGVDRKPQAHVAGAKSSPGDDGVQEATPKIKYRFQRDVMNDNSVNYMSDDGDEGGDDDDATDDTEAADNVDDNLQIGDEEDEDEDYEEDEYEYYEAGDSFKEGDFDNAPRHHTKPPLRFKPAQSANANAKSRPAQQRRSDLRPLHVNDANLHAEGEKNIALSAKFQTLEGEKQGTVNRRQEHGFRVSGRANKLNGFDTPLSDETLSDTNRAVLAEKAARPCGTGGNCDTELDSQNRVINNRATNRMPGKSKAANSGRRNGDVHQGNLKGVNEVNARSDGGVLNSNIKTHHSPNNQHHLRHHIPVSNNTISNNGERAEDLPRHLANKIETQIPIQEGFGANPEVQKQPATQIQVPELSWQPGEVRSAGGTPLVVDKVYWSKEVEQLVPKGKTDEDFQRYLHTLGHHHVVQMLASDWTRCGRPKNQYVVLDDGTAMCARYRDPHNKLVQGEVLSFYLSRLLGLDNVPFVVLSQVNTSAPMWSGQDLAAADWDVGKYVGLIQWINDLERSDKYRSRVKMPPPLLAKYEANSTFDHRSLALRNLTADELADLLQWSDLIIFDYLTGNYDRVASMQDGADRSDKPEVIQENIRNLRKTWQTRKLWFIDNESGFLDAYDLMYHGRVQGRKFLDYHHRMLKTMCVFRRETADRLYRLESERYPAELLVKYTAAQDPLFDQLPRDTPEFKLFHKFFHTRLKDVKDWIAECRRR